MSLRNCSVALWKPWIEEFKRRPLITDNTKLENKNPRKILNSYNQQLSELGTLQISLIQKSFPNKPPKKHLWYILAQQKERPVRSYKAFAYSVLRVCLFSMNTLSSPRPPTSKGAELSTTCCYLKRENGKCAACA